MLHRFRLSLGALLALAALMFAGQALATGTVRLEYLKAGQVLTTENVSSSGASVQSAATPSFGGVTGSVRIVGLAGVVIVTPAGTSPTATQSNGYRIQACSDPITLPIADGQKLAIIEAADASTCPSGSGAQNLAAASTGGATVAGVASGASTNATNLTAQATTLLGGQLINTTTTGYCIRFYNLATTPTASSATGFVFSIPIPPGAASGQYGGTLLTPGTFGGAFSTGLGYVITGGCTSTDATNGAVGVYGFLSYK